MKKIRTGGCVPVYPKRFDPLPIIKDITRRNFLVGAGGLVLLAPYGCGSGEEGESGSSGETRTVEHALGTTEVPRKPERIASMDGEETLEAMLALGVQPVATARPSSTGEIPAYVLEKVEGEMEDLGEQTQPNLETLAAEEPDLIIGSSEDIEAVYPELSEIAPTLVRQTNQEEWRADFREVARFLGNRDGAKAQIAAFDERAARLLEGAGTRLTASAVRLIPGGGDLYLLTPDSFTGSVLADAGLEVPEEQRNLESPDPRYVQISSERIPLLDADYVFVCVDEGGEEDLARLRENPLWKGLDGTVFEVSSARWVFGSILSANAILDDLEKFLEGGGS